MLPPRCGNAHPKHTRQDHERVLAALRQAKPSGNGWRRTECPFCYSRIRNPFGISLRTGYWHCFACTMSGVTREIVGEYADVVEDEVLPEHEFDPPESYYPLGWEPALSSESYAAARAYLEKRKVPIELQQRLEIGACLDGKFRDRIIVPLLEGMDGEWTGFVARSFTPSEVPYIYPQRMLRQLYLAKALGLFNVAQEPLLVVEGVFDALALYPHAVAMLGKVTEAHWRILLAARRPLVFVLDGDSWQEAWAMCARLRFEGQQAGHVRLPAAIDPDEVDRSWLLSAAIASIAKPL